MRLNYKAALPAGYRAMVELGRVAGQSTLEPALLELVKLRASQLNGCAYCLDMHSKDARALGETQQRLDLLTAWQEAPVDSVRERAALGWCESITLLADTGAPDQVYDELSACFTPEEQVALTIAIVAINGWNRLAVGFRSPVGDYISPPQSAAATPAPPTEVQRQWIFGSNAPTNRPPHRTATGSWLTGCGRAACRALMPSLISGRVRSAPAPRSGNGLAMIPPASTSSAGATSKN